MTPKVAAVRRKDETTTRSNKNGDYRIHTKTWLSTNSTLTGCMIYCEPGNAKVMLKII